MSQFLRAVVCAAALAILPRAAAEESAPVLDLQRRSEPAKPFDGNSRYKEEQEDSIREIQGLTELASRFGVKPYAQLRKGNGEWQEERIVFRDVDSGALMMRLTDDRWSDWLSYYEGNWSADGKTIVWRRAPGMYEASTDTHGPMAMNADGTHLRNVFRDYQMVRGETCSPTDPNICYAQADGDTKIVAFDLTTGKTQHLIHEVPHGWALKVSPDGKFLMNIYKTSDRKAFWICGVDGTGYHEIPLALDQPMHDSYRFHPTQPNTIMYWFDGKFYTEGFVQCDFQGNNRRNVNVILDWNHGAFGMNKAMGVDGYVTAVAGDAWSPRQELFFKTGGEKIYEDPPSFNGYSTWWPKDQPWCYNTRIVFPPYVSELGCWTDEPAPDYCANRYRICYTGLRRGLYLDNPNASPDGTKILFNSNMLGANNIYCVVSRFPEAPRDLKAEALAAGFKLSWAPPHHHAEIRGYHVYRAENPHSAFVRVTTKPLETLEYSDKSTRDRNVCYAITAVEHSGLESILSNEARPGREANTVCLEAEVAKLNTEMWVGFQGSASNLHYIWMRKPGGIGKAEFVLTSLKHGGEFTLWAQVKGPDGLQFKVNSGASSASINAPGSTAWTWVKASGTITVKTGDVLTLSTEGYGHAVDRIVLTADPEFTPEHLTIQWPDVAAAEKVHAVATSPYSAHVTWTAKTAATFHHYNVYCSREANVVISQKNLIASPAEPALLDWKLKPGQTYSYRVTCVNCAGIESQPTEAATVTTPPLKTFKLEMDFAPNLEFETPAQDVYAVWLKLKNKDAGAGDVTVRVDGKGNGIWFARMDNQADPSWLNWDDWGRFDLAAGKHALTVGNKTGYEIEKVLITNDLSATPAGHVNVLGGW